jgi:3-dehydroquinate synthase
MQEIFNMEKILIQTNSKKYPLYLGIGIITHIIEILEATQLPISKLLIISDKTVASFYLKTLVEQLADGYQVHTKVVESGEQAKSFQNYYECQTAALESGLDRDSVIIALGGGVIGDLAGFVAATFMRGIPFIQVPTTLLAHDSSVGGKVAINHPMGKNMIGAFYQPDAVVYDVNLLATLPSTEIRSGLAEIIKHGMIGDETFYKWLRSEINILSDMQNDVLLHAIKSGISVKANIISKDERESGIRAFLNFGHTLGHAIEAEMGYGKISHGDAIAIGMLFALNVSEHYFQISLNYDDIRNWFKALSFPTKIPAGLSTEHIINRMKHDKKAKNGVIRMVLLKEISEVIVVELEDDYIQSLLKSF